LDSEPGEADCGVSIEADIVGKGQAIIQGQGGSTAEHQCAAAANRTTTSQKSQAASAGSGDVAVDDDVVCRLQSQGVGTAR
jgi:hypothetical protein